MLNSTRQSAEPICLEQQSCDAAHTGKPYGHLRVAFHEARAEVLRLYALASAAPQRPTVSLQDLKDHLRDFRMGFLDEYEVARALGVEVVS